jgi:uncharacterized membrane protein HdeD (DUF308 family)
MSTREPLTSEGLGATAGGALRQYWGLFLFEGILLLVLGVLALAVPVVASIAATIFFGWLLLLSGIMGLITTFRARHTPGFGWSLASAVIGIIAGVLLLAAPLQGVLSLTAVLIAFLFIEGIASILYALEHRRGLSVGWGWMLASGIVDVILAGILFAGLPGTAVWALGVLLGINLIFGGSALSTMALAARPRTAI